MLDTGYQAQMQRSLGIHKINTLEDWKMIQNKTVSIYANADQALKELRDELFSFGFKPLAVDRVLSDALDFVDGFHHAQTFKEPTQLGKFATICQREWRTDETADQVASRIQGEVSGAFRHLIDPPQQAAQ